MIVRSDGLGATPPTSSLISSGLTTGTAIASATGGTAALLAAIGVGAQAVPVVGTIIGGVALLIGALGIGNGCGSSCTEATQVANYVAPLFGQNVAAAQAQAQANGGCLTSAEQATAVANFNSLWTYLVNGCTQVGGAGGKQCIADRQRGGKDDVFACCLDPINAIPVCSGASAVAASVGGSSLLLWGAVALLVVGLFGGEL